MNIFIIHPNFPAQYFNLSQYLAKNPENKVIFLAERNSIEVNFKDVTLAIYQGANEQQENWIKTCGTLKTTAEAVIEGQVAIRALNEIKRKYNLKPDVILGHTGWGSLLYCKDLYPNVPILGYFEWYYHSENCDSFWWPDEVPKLRNKISMRTKNAHHLLDLEMCDCGVTPTNWQYEQFPEVYKHKLKIIHDGIDTKFCSPSSTENSGLVLEDIKLNLPPGTELITYVSRGLEPYRGFPQFMDAIRLVLSRRKNAHVIVVGVDRVCYGAQRKDGESYLKDEEAKGGYPIDRVHFVGLRNRGDYQKILRASSCHVYLTRPFVLSWSVLEAMSFACPVVASKTPPVQEVMEDNFNGLLAEFRSPYNIAAKIEEILDNPERAKKLGKNARETILERYELDKCLNAQENLINNLVR